MKKILVLAAMFAVVFVGKTEASLVTIGWEMSGLSTYGPTPFNASSDNVAVTAQLIRGSGVTTSGTAANNGWGGNGFNSNSLANAIAAGDFVSVSLIHSGSDLFSLTGIGAFNVRRSGAGPTTGQFQYLNNSNVWTNIGSTITWGAVTSASGNSQAAIDLSSIADLQNRSAGTLNLRIVNWGASDAGGNWYLNQFQSGSDFVFSGQLTAVPEPSALLLVGSIVGAGFLRRRRA